MAGGRTNAAYPFEESRLAMASASLRNLDWFEVVDVRGSIRDNKVANYQVTLKLGFRYQPKA